MTFQSNQNDQTQSARQREAAMLDRCMAVINGVEAKPGNPAEASLFRLAGSVLRSRLPHASARLKAASASYVAAHPEMICPSSEELVRQQLIVSPTRLRDTLSHRLGWGGHG